jgi:hypothetical protein
VIRGLSTVPVPSGSGGETLDLPPRYFMELRLPAFSGLGDEQKNQTVPRLAKLVVSCTFHTNTRKDDKYVLS